MEKMEIFNKSDDKGIRTFETCIFKRTENSHYEYGLCLNDGDTILDLKGNEVFEIYDWNRSAVEVSKGIDLNKISEALRAVSEEGKNNFEKEEKLVLSSFKEGKDFKLKRSEEISKEVDEYLNLIESIELKSKCKILQGEVEDSSGNVYEFGWDSQETVYMVTSKGK